MQIVVPVVAEFSWHMILIGRQTLCGKYIKRQRIVCDTAVFLSNRFDVSDTLKKRELISNWPFRKIYLGFI